jgi:branched-chain amino acid aminotransferase
MNVFIVRDGAVITPPITDNILEGITRRSVMELARVELDLPVVERPIDRSELYLCEEVFMTGTAAQVTAVTKVDNRPIGSGVMGPVAGKLRQIFGEVVRGMNPKYAHWNVAV